jgi:predicted RNase H-like HicB family nuclease
LARPWDVARLFREFPDYLTQGESLEQLQENLRDLYMDLTGGELKGIRRVAELSLG